MLKQTIKYLIISICGLGSFNRSDSTHVVSNSLQKTHPAILHSYCLLTGPPNNVLVCVTVRVFLFFLDTWYPQGVWKFHDRSWPSGQVWNRHCRPITIVSYVCHYDIVTYYDNISLCHSDGESLSRIMIISTPNLWVYLLQICHVRKTGFTCRYRYTRSARDTPDTPEQ